MARRARARGVMTVRTDSARRGLVRRVVVALLLTTSAPSAAAQWPTLHRDYQRSGHTSEMVKGPYERKWWRDFHDEMIATRCEAILAEDRVFVGTLAGNVYAMGFQDGRTLWKHEAAGPIGASPCFHDGKLYFGSDDAFDRGTLHCLDAATGAVVWEHSTPAGIWTSPACDGRRVFVGDRSGLLHAVDASDGSPDWTFQTEYLILKPISFGVDRQRLVLGSEDMRVYCLSPSGRLLWKSPRLPGLSLRDQGATIWKGLAIVRTNPADPFHTVLGRNGEALEAIQRAVPMTDEDQVLLDKWGDLLLAPRPERRKAEIEGVVEYLKNNRHDRSFFALDLRDGSEPWIAPVLYTAGLHNPPTPPTFHPETGELYTLSRSALTHYVRGVRRYSCLARIDRSTGLPDRFWPERDERDWRRFPMIPDETQALGMMGDLILGTHQGELAALDPARGDVTTISPTRDTYAGIFGPGAVEGSFEGAARLAARGFLTGLPNEWHGPDRAIVSVAAGRMFWIAGSQVVCIAGPDVARTPSGGSRPPDVFESRLPEVTPGGNVASRGRNTGETSEPVPVFTADQVRRFLELPDTEAGEPDDELASALRGRLDAEVSELVTGDEEGRPWAPLVVQLGISGPERHFWRTGTTIRVLSQALPHLSAEVRARTLAYLDPLVRSGCPMNRVAHTTDGARREPFELGPATTEFAARIPGERADIADAYALWAYAHHGDRWSAALDQKERLIELFDRFVDHPSRFDPDDMQRDASQRLNRDIAGLIGAARIFQRSGDDARRETALRLLARAVSERVHHERVDHRLVRPTRGETGGIHQAKVPRYVDLVPESAAMLGDLAGESLERHVADLRRALPLWYQAYGERMIGGENYMSPPHLSRGLLVAWADGTGAARADLATKLDQPWCRADLYYIEKLCAILRRRL